MNTRYKIKGNEENFALTNISHIGFVKREGDEWLTLKKTFPLSSLPELAAIRFDSRGVSAVYINGSYIAANTGRYANRITNAECTSRLQLGENEIKIVLGGHYYQTVEETFYARRKARFSSVAACLELISGEKIETVSTDSSCVRVSSPPVSYVSRLVVFSSSSMNGSFLSRQFMSYFMNRRNRLCLDSE